MKHASPSELKKDMDILLSRINALEVSTSDKTQKGMLAVMRALAASQMHSLEEFEHLKKAIDLLTQQFFDVKNKTDKLR